MLTKIDQLDLTNLADSIAMHQTRLAYFANLAETDLPIETFVHIADDFTVDRVAFCVLDTDIISVVFAVDCQREDLRSLAQHYTQAVALRVYVEDDYMFPLGDDWVVESLNLTLLNPKEKDVPEYAVEREGNHVTITQGELTCVGTQMVIGEDEVLEIMCLGPYVPEADAAIDVAIDYCAKNKLKLLMNCNSGSWSHPLRVNGFGNERWGVRCNVATL